MRLARFAAAQAASAVLFGWRADKFNDGCLFVAVGREFVRSQRPTRQIPLQKPAQRGGPVMCDRIGCTHFPKLSEMDFSGAAAQPSRRRFLKGAAAVSTISMGMLAGTAHAGAPVKSTHGSGFCNLNIFLAHSRQYAKGAGTELVFIDTQTSAE